MLTITTHNFLFFTRKEIWFYNGEKIPNGSYTVFCYSKARPREYEMFLPEQSTFIDLDQDEAQLFAGMTRTYRYQIRKAQRSGLVTAWNDKPSFSDCEKFLAEFNVFANSKQFTKASSRRIHALRQSGHLVITSVLKNGEALINHVYLHDTRTAVLLHTFHRSIRCSEYERGIANKYLHWQDMLDLKKRGFETYDLGGINFETVPGISKFKLDFGAKIYDVHNYVSTKKWLAPALRVFKKLQS